MEGFLSFHFFCIQLSHLLHNLLGKNLHNLCVSWVITLTGLTLITESAFFTKK